MSQPDYPREGAALAAPGLPEETEIGGAVRMRTLTAGSAAPCALCGNRPYLPLTGDSQKLGELTDYDLLEFVYLHTAPLRFRRRDGTVGTKLPDARKF